MTPRRGISPLVLKFVAVVLVCLGALYAVGANAQAHAQTSPHPIYHFFGYSPSTLYFWNWDGATSTVRTVDLGNWAAVRTTEAGGPFCLDGFEE